MDKIKIGGSDLPIILNMNEYTSIWELARVKVGIDQKPYSANRYTKNGQFMEPKVRNYINTKYGFNFIPAKEEDIENGYVAKCDGLDIEHDALVEIKTFMKELKVDYYRPQCEFYMQIFNRPICLLVGYKTNENFFNGSTFKDKVTGEERDSLFEKCYNTNFYPGRVVIHRFFRDKDYFKSLEEKIKIFQILSGILNTNRDMTREEFYKNYYYCLELLEAEKEEI